MSEKDAAAQVVAHGAREHRRPVPRRVLAAFDALALHDAHAADPLDGAGIQLALEWEWERAGRGIPEGIAREELVALTGGPAPIETLSEGGAREPNEEARRGANGEEEEAA